MGKALAVALVIVVALFPSVAFFVATPMLPVGWHREMHDPSVSEWVFIPLFKVFRTELYQHGTILWSNLRSMGLPTLGNGVQAAPLFPLTLILSWLPEHLFWNALILSRLLLLGMGAFLIARSSMKLAALPSALFAMTFAYSIHLLGWINHVYLNGVVAGLWCLFFAIESLRDLDLAWTAARRRRLPALALCTYSLFTCGFPESMAWAGLQIILVSLPLVIARVRSPWRANALTAVELSGGAALGTAIAAPQIFALAEYVSTAGTRFRQDLGFAQLAVREMPIYFLKMLTLLGDKGPAPPIVHLFNLIPLLLAMVGLVAAAAGGGRRFLWLIGAVLCAAFFILKSFQIWPWFNLAVGAIPVLNRCLFLTYFFPLVLWAFAWFVAEGAGALHETLTSESPRLSRLAMGLITTAAFIAILFAVAEAARVVRGVSYLSILSGLREKPGQILLVYGAAFILIVATLAGRNRSSRWWQIALFILALTELGIVRSPLFANIADRKARSYSDPAVERALVEASHELGVSPRDARLADKVAVTDTRFAGAGFASPDNGASPAYPERLGRFREALFQLEWTMARARFTYSWSVTATRFFLLREGSDFPGPKPSKLALVEKVGDSNVTFDPETLSRAYLASSCVSAGSLDAAEAILTDPGRFSPGTAIVEEMAAGEREACAKLSGPAKAVPIEKDSGSEVRLSPIGGPGFLVLGDTYYPGWQAIDLTTGREMAIKPVNMTLRGVALPESRDYQIEFVYRPWWRGLALASSLCGLAVAAALLLRRGNVARVAAGR